MCVCECVCVCVAPVGSFGFAQRCSRALLEVILFLEPPPAHVFQLGVGGVLRGVEGC